MVVRGIQGLTIAELVRQVRAGGRFVVFPWTIGLVAGSVDRASCVHFVRPGQNAITRAIRYIVATLLLGWWAIPFGPIRAWRALRTTLRGGQDVTAKVLGLLTRAETRPADHPRPPARAA